MVDRRVGGGRTIWEEGGETHYTVKGRGGEEQGRWFDGIKGRVMTAGRVERMKSSRNPSLQYSLGNRTRIENILASEIS